MVSPKESTDALKTFTNQINRCVLLRCALSRGRAQAGLFFLNPHMITLDPWASYCSGRQTSETAYD